MAATLKVRFLADTVGFSAGVKGANNDLTGFEKATKTVSANIGKALAAISFVAVVKGLTDAAKAASDDAIEQANLARQLKTSTGATDAQIASVEKSIDAMSRATGISDGTLRPALQNAARATGSVTEAQKLLAIGLDAAAATGKPLDTVMNALNKAYNGNTIALYKLAPELKTTKGGIDDLAASVKGAAAVTASPFAKFKVSLNEAKETIGAAFLPVLEKLMAALGPLVDKLAPILAKLIGDLTPIFLDLVDALLPLIEQLLPPLVELITALVPVIVPLIKILTDLLVPIIKIIVSVFKAWLGYFKPIIDFVGVLVNAFKTGFSAIVGFIKGPINLILGAIEAYFNFVIKGVNLLIGGINLLLKGVNAVTGMKLKVPTIGAVKIPRLAQGGVVMPSPGGSIVNVAEAGKPEAIIPLDKMGAMGGGNTYVININKASITGEEIVQAIRRYEVSRGRTVTL